MSGKFQRQREWSWGQWPKYQISLCQSIHRKRYADWMSQKEQITLQCTEDSIGGSYLVQFLLQEGLPISHCYRMYTK
jgi:hypothetical protein